MDKLKEIINYILSARNIKSILIIATTILAGSYIFNMAILPKINAVSSLKNDISANKERLEGLIKTKKAKDLEEKKNIIKIDKVPVTIYKSSTPGLPAESASIDFVTKIIETLEQTQNTILDISYKINPLTENDKISMPSTIEVVQLVMTLNSTYSSFQDFVYNLYDYDYIATIKQIKVTPLKENKKTLEINTVIWLYVSK